MEVSSRKEEQCQLPLDPHSAAYATAHLFALFRAPLFKTTCCRPALGPGLASAEALVVMLADFDEVLAAVTWGCLAAAVVKKRAPRGATVRATVANMANV